MTYCTDQDLLLWEPNLFRDAVFASQALIAGTGDLAGGTFTIASGSLTDAHVEAGQVIVLTGAVEGCFPIVSVDSATQLTLSVMYDGLFPDEGDGEPSPVGTAAGLGYAIRTFWPQRQIVSELLRAAAGVGSDTLQPNATLVSSSALRRPCALGTLQAIYNALAAASTDAASLLIRADLYQRLYRRAIERTLVEIDTDGDGEADLARCLGVGKFVRT